MLTGSLQLQSHDTFAGWIDLADLAATPVAPAALRGAAATQSLVRPGALLAWRGSGVSVAVREATFCLAVGAPRFDDGRCAALARDDGPAAAWLALLDGDPARDLRDVHEEYAVLFCDARRARVLAAVDRFARHGVCYRLDGTRLGFASRANEVPGESRALDPQALYNYAFHHMIPAPRTIFAGVRRLDAAHRLEFTRDGAHTTRHWQPDFTVVQRPFAERKAAFVAALEAAVARQLEPGVTGCYLSGGTDSSTVAGMAQRVQGSPVKTFSIGFDASGYDEMEYARIAARHFGTEHHEYYVTPEDVLAGVPAIAAWYDQPFGNSSVVPSFLCAQLAQRNGVTRVLAGDGGDELYGGNSRYREEQLFAAYAAIPGVLRRGAIEPALTTLGALPVGPLRKLGRFAAVARMSPSDRQQRFNLLDHVGAANVLGPALLSQVDPGEPMTALRAAYAATPRRAPPLDRMLALEWKYILADNDLAKVVWSARLAGVRAAFPLLDDRVVDLSLSLPTWQKVRGTRLRHFFKEALADFLPPQIIAKKKHGFALPFGVWLLRDARLMSFASAALESLRDRGVIAAGLVDAVVQARNAPAAAYYGELVWVMMVLEHWLLAHAPAFRAT